MDAPGPGRLLRDPAFRRLWAAEALTLVAEGLLLVVLTLLVLEVAGAGAALGTVLAVAAVPRAVLLPFGGVLADRLGPARVAVTTTWLRAGVLGLLAALVLAGPPPVWAIAALAALLGVLDAAAFPAALALLPAVVPARDLGPANALVQGAESAGDLVGPALAAVLVATLGLGGALLGVAALHVLAALALTSLLPRLAAARGAPAAEDAPTLRALAEGVRFAFGDPVLRLVLLLLAVLNVAVAGPVLVGGAVLAEEHLGGAERLGLLFAGFGAGSLAGLAAGALARPARRGAVLVACAAVLGATLAALGAARSLAAAVPLAAVMGLGAGFLGVVLVAWLQERVPAALRGRVMALVAFCAVALDPLSFALAGALLPLGTDVLLAAAGGLLVAWAAAALLVPAVRGLR